MLTVAPRSLPRPQQHNGPERDECGPDDIVQMDAVSSWKNEDDSVKAIGIEPDDCRAYEDEHHCEQPPQRAEQLTCP